MGVVAMVADWTDKDNWVIGEFLNAVGQPAIPYYPVVLPGKDGKPAKVVALPEQLTLQGKRKFIEALEAALDSAGVASTE